MIQGRITPEAVLAASQATGIKMARTGHDWFDADGCGCAAAAMIALKEPGFCNPHWPFPMAAACLGVSRDYLRGFVRGFEGRRLLLTILDGDKTQGYLDGRAVAQAVFPDSEESA